MVSASNLVFRIGPKFASVIDVGVKNILPNNETFSAIRSLVMNFLISFLFPTRLMQALLYRALPFRAPHEIYTVYGTS
jgi:hypothetical protein